MEKAETVFYSFLQLGCIIKNAALAAKTTHEWTVDR